MSNPQLMIAEDERVVALDLKNRLDAMGYEVCALVSTGREAVEQAVARHPEVILMDIMLEGDMDGIEAAGLIRKEFPIPIIYVTSYVDDATLERAKVTEPFGYIIKPFEDKELDLNIRMALYKNKVERKLVDNERWLSTTLKSIGDAVVTTDRDGMVQFLNPAGRIPAGLGIARSRGTEFQRHLPGLCAGRTDFPGIHRTMPPGALRPVQKRRRHGGGHGGRPEDSHCGQRVAHRGQRRVRGRVRGGLPGHHPPPSRPNWPSRTAWPSSAKTLDETVNVLTLVSEKRDPYTAGHQQRVGELAAAIAERMGLTAEAVEGIRVAGGLHDIGKIYVPAEILSKPSRLTSIEFRLVKSHSEVGHEILKSVSFPWPVADVVLQHHERMDGSGYPAGLTGDEIIPEARIVAVADVVEAMSSHRPYRAALGIEPALREIEKNRGRFYDPDSVDVCLELFAEGFRFSPV